jgi:1,5-anhydro-D-fructose reductase (1,5-anhydro-D-mannitol-forming)
MFDRRPRAADNGARMLRIGIIGFGFMGRVHTACWQRLPDAEVVALCDSNPHCKEDAKRVLGNIRSADHPLDFDQLQTYHDIDDLLAHPGLNVVSIALPTHLHAAATVRALHAGMHVLCEKPMALTLEQCDRMVAASSQSGKVLQIGHCIRFWPEYAKAAELVRSGRYGQVLAATFRRLSAAPTWGVEGWLTDEVRSGGLTLDLHVHDTDYILYLLGRPRAVHSRGVRGDAGGVVHMATDYLYADTRVVTAEGSWAVMPSLGFQMGFALVLSSATLIYDSAQSPTFKVYPREGEAFAPDLAEGDGYTRQIEHFARRVRGEACETVTTVEGSRESVEVVLAEAESIRTGQIISLR